MANIRYDIIGEEQIELCRPLCNELMAFQKSKAFLEVERFDAMNFDTRMKSSYKNAEDKQVVVAFDGDEPIAYIFSTMDRIEEMRASRPPFIPPFETLPERIGIVSNLYIRDAYRGHGVGRQLMAMSNSWFQGFKDIDLIMVYVSNGNDDAYSFYQKFGFIPSHDVLGGFIKALYRYQV